tara:strand:- start:12223 stop:12402 length:180 start_codon:yes stop_codon:yes gene_type:complete
MDMLLNAKDWVMDRVGERTSIDGLGLIVICGSVILFGGIAKLLAWVGLAWGVYTLVKSD